MMIPGVDLNQIVDGRTLEYQWEFYTVNVKKLGTMTHEEFCAERPEAAQAIASASAKMDKLSKLLEE